MADGDDDSGVLADPTGGTLLKAAFRGGGNIGKEQEAFLSGPQRHRLELARAFQPAFAFKLNRTGGPVESARGQVRIGVGEPFFNQGW